MSFEICYSLEAHIQFASCRFAIVQPVADKTSLQLESEGLAVLRGITSPVAPVVVIGPYRSGKSFLLNQLLGVGCGTKPSPCTSALQLILCIWKAQQKQIVSSDAEVDFLNMQMKALALDTPGEAPFVRRLPVVAIEVCVKDSG